MEFFWGISLLIVLMAESRGAETHRDRKVTDDPPMFDASDVNWAHAVNSREAIEREILGNVDFLEADISLGRVFGNTGPAIPIMAHPPDTTSDISLDNWLDIIINRGKGQGIKLDFKSLEVVEPSLKILESHSSKLDFPLWLNADVLPGPVNATATPVQVEEFLRLSHHYFPKATLSLGWSTYWFSTLPPETWRYSWSHVRKMVDAIHCSKDISSNITFPVRGIFASRSVHQLQWLLNIIPHSTLTVWSAKVDALTLDDLLRTRTSFQKQQVYYDIPEPTNTAFQKAKNSVTIPKPMPIDEQWLKIDREQPEYTSETYITNETIVFGNTTTAVFFKDSFIVKHKHGFQAKGFVTFSEDIKDHASHNLSIFLLDLDSLSSKNLNFKKGDEETKWFAINSSIIYTFDQSSSCYIFKLDSELDVSFQVWNVPCDIQQSNAPLEEIAKSGKPQISQRTRLIFPKGPLMFGFLSDSSIQTNGHAVVHGIEISGTREQSTSNSPPLLTMSLGLISFGVITAAILNY